MLLNVLVGYLLYLTSFALASIAVSLDWYFIESYIALPPLEERIAALEKYRSELAQQPLSRSTLRGRPISFEGAYRERQERLAEIDRAVESERRYSRVKNLGGTFLMVLLWTGLFGLFAVKFYLWAKEVT